MLKNSIYMAIYLILIGFMVFLISSTIKTINSNVITLAESEFEMTCKKPTRKSFLVFAHQYGKSISHTYNKDCIEVMSKFEKKELEIGISELNNKLVYLKSGTEYVIGDRSKKYSGLSILTYYVLMIFLLGLGFRKSLRGFQVHKIKRE